MRNAQSALHNYYPDRPVQSSTISTSWEAYECLKNPKGEYTQQSDKICHLPMAGYPF